MNTLTALKRCSLGLDRYLWLVYRTFPLHAPLRLPWLQVYRQFGPNPNNAATHDAVQNFRRRILRELKKIKLAWPGVELLDSQGRLDPSSLNSRDRPAQSRPARPLGSPFPTPGLPLTASAGRPGPSGLPASRIALSA